MVAGERGQERVPAEEERAAVQGGGGRAVVAAAGREQWTSSEGTRVVEAESSEHEWTNDERKVHGEFERERDIARRCARTAPAECELSRERRVRTRLRTSV